MPAIAARLRRFALLSPVSVALAVGLALPLETGAAAGKGDRLPLRCGDCTGNVVLAERIDDAAAGVTTLIRLPAITTVEFGAGS